MANTNELTEQLFGAISTIGQAQLAQLAYDQTIEGTVIDDSNKDLGYYRCMSQSSTFDAYSVNNATYYKNDPVYIQIPQGDYNKQKFIIGRRAATGTDGTPFVYEEPLDKFICFEKLEAAFLERAYFANQPEQGNDNLASSEYILARQRIQEKLDKLIKKRDAAINAVKQAYEQAVADFVDEEGNVIGSEGQDGSKIKVPFNTVLATNINKAVNNGRAVDLDLSYDAYMAFNNDATHPQCQLTIQTIQMALLGTEYKSSAIVDSDLQTLNDKLINAWRTIPAWGWNYQDSMAAHRGIWNEYWCNEGGRTIGGYKIEDRKQYVKECQEVRDAEIERLNALYKNGDPNHNQSETDPLYNPGTDFYNQELERINNQFNSSDVAHNDNLLWYWKRAAGHESMPCTKLGIEALWMTYLFGYAPISGEYGLRILVTGNAVGTDDLPGGVVTHTKWFTSKDMYGNPYAYTLPYKHQLIIDVSEYQEVTQIEIYFWQDHNFLDTNGEIIPYPADPKHTDDIPNIYSKGMSVMLGMTADEFDSDKVFLWTYDEKKFGAADITDEASDMDLEKEMHFVWVHKDGDDIVLVNNATKLNQYNAQICWYRRNPDVIQNPANYIETYGGYNFELITDASTAFTGSLEDYMQNTPSTSWPSDIQVYYTAREYYQADLISIWNNNELTQEEKQRRANIYIETNSNQLATKRAAAEEAYESIQATAGVYDKFDYTATLDPAKQFEAFRVAVIFDNSYIPSDILTFQNRSNVEGFGNTDKELIFKVLRRKYKQESNGQFVNDGFTIDENRQGFFVYDERNGAIADEANHNYADIDFYLQIWILNHKTGEYQPLILSEGSVDDLTVNWHFPSPNSMLTSWDYLTHGHETDEAEQIAAALFSASGITGGASYTNADLQELRGNVDYILKTTRKFRIQRHWDIRYTNNTVVAEIEKSSGQKATVEQTFVFGNNSTDGSPFVIAINLDAPANAQGLIQGQKFELHAMLYNSNGTPFSGTPDAPNCGGAIFTWELLSPTIITPIPTESNQRPVWQESSWGVGDRGGMGNYIYGYVYDDNPPIFKVTVTNAADYELTQLYACMMTNDIKNIDGTNTTLYQTYNYSTPNRVEFKSNGESPVYLSSAFLKWRDEGEQRIFYYPEWTLRQWHKQKLDGKRTITYIDAKGIPREKEVDNIDFVLKDEPDYLNLRIVTEKDKELQTTVNPEITSDQLSEIKTKMCAVENFDEDVTIGDQILRIDYNTNINGDPFDWTKSTTYNKMRDFLTDLYSTKAQLAYETAYSNIKNNDTYTADQKSNYYQRLESWLIDVGRAGVYAGQKQLNIFANKYIESYNVYYLNPYADPEMTQPWTWIDGMDTDYYTVLSYEEEPDAQGNVLWIRQAICFDRNLYCSSTINAWDGSLTIDKEKNQILTRMLAAGVKDSSNRFSGVMMGDWHEHADSSLEAIGLYGFDAGAQVFAFKSDGTGFIGPSGHGQITFDGRYGLISNYNRSCYMNLDPNLVNNKTGKMLVGHDQGYSQYFLYVKTPRILDDLGNTIEDIQTKVSWASKYVKDEAHQYFIVDPTYGVLTTGGVIANYGKIGNWLIGDHGLYQIHKAEEASSGIPFKNHYMYLGYDSTKGGGGTIEDPSTIQLYLNRYYPEWQTDNNGSKNIYHLVITKTDGAVTSLTVASIANAIDEKHRVIMEALRGPEMSEEDEADYLLQIINHCHDYLPTDCFRYDPVHYMNYGWGAQWVVDYLNECKSHFTRESSQTDITAWLKANIEQVINRTNWDFNIHSHYNADGSVQSANNRTGGAYVAFPLLGYSRSWPSTFASSEPTPSKENTFYGRRPDSAWFATMWADMRDDAVSYDDLIHYANLYHNIYNFYFVDYYKQLVEIWAKATKNREERKEPFIPDAMWDEIHLLYPKFFEVKETRPSEDGDQAVINELIAEENGRYLAELRELYIHDDENKYAIYCSYYDKQDENDYETEPIFSVNWRGYMTARAGKIGHTSPFYVTDYGLTQKNNSGIIFLGDPEAPSWAEQWTTVHPRDRARISLLANESVIIDNNVTKKVYLYDLFAETINTKPWVTAVQNNEAIIVKYNADRTGFTLFTGTLKNEDNEDINLSTINTLSETALEQLNNGESKLGVPAFNTFGNYAIYAGPINGTVNFGVRLDGTVTMTNAELTGIRINYSRADNSQFTDVDIFNNRFQDQSGNTAYSYQTTHEDGKTIYYDSEGNRMEYQGGTLQVTGPDGTTSTLNPDGMSYSYIADGKTIEVAMRYPTPATLAASELDEGKTALLAAQIIESNAILTTGKLSGWMTSGDGAFVNYKVIEADSGNKISEAISLDAENSQIRCADSQIIIDGLNGVLYIGRKVVNRKPNGVPADTADFETWAQMYLGAVGIQVKTDGYVQYQGGHDQDGNITSSLQTLYPASYDPISFSGGTGTDDGQFTDIPEDDDPASLGYDSDGGYLVTLDIQNPEGFQMPQIGNPSQPRTGLAYDWYNIGHTKFMVDDQLVDNNGATPYQRAGVGLHFITEAIETGTSRDWSYDDLSDLNKFGIVNEGILYYPLTNGSILGAPDYNADGTIIKHRWTIYSKNIFVDEGSKIYLGQNDEVASLHYVNYRLILIQKNIVSVNNKTAEAIRLAQNAIRKAQKAINLAWEALNAAVVSGTLDTEASGSAMYKKVVMQLTTRGGTALPIQTADLLLSSQHSHVINIDFTNKRARASAAVEVGSESGSDGAFSGFDEAIQKICEDYFKSKWSSIEISASGGGSSGDSFTVTISPPGGTELEDITKDFTVTLDKGLSNGEYTYKTSSHKKPDGCTYDGTCYSRSDGGTRYSSDNINPTWSI